VSLVGSGVRLTAPCTIVEGGSLDVSATLLNDDTFTNRGSLGIRTPQWQNGIAPATLDGNGNFSRRARLVNSGSSARLEVTADGLLQNRLTANEVLNEFGGRLIVSGSGAAFINSDSAVVNNLDLGTELRIENGALFRNTLPGGAGNTTLVNDFVGEIRVSGSGSRLENVKGASTSAFDAVLRNNGILVVESGASLVNDRARLRSSFRLDARGEGSRITNRNGGQLLSEDPDSISFVDITQGASLENSGRDSRLLNGAGSMLLLSGSNTRLLNTDIARFESTGNASVTDGAVFENRSHTLNSGTFSVFGGSIDNDAVESSIGEFVNRGTLTLGEGARFDNGFARLANVRGGRITLASGGILDNHGPLYVENRDAGTVLSVGAGSTLTHRGRGEAPGFVNADAAEIDIDGGVFEVKDNAQFFNQGDGTRLTLREGGGLTNSAEIYNSDGAVIDVQAGSRVLNSGRIFNASELRVAGTFLSPTVSLGPGRLDNEGLFRVLAGGSATVRRFERTDDRASVLERGEWRLEGGDTATASLRFIDRNGGLSPLDRLGAGAVLRLSGKSIALDNTDLLRNIDGRLEIGAGQEFTPAYDIRNHGRIAVLDGGTLRVTRSIDGNGSVDNQGSVAFTAGANALLRTEQVQGDALLGGRWRFDAMDGATGSRLSDAAGTAPATIARIGSAARVSLAGADEPFTQMLEGLARVEGELELGRGLGPRIARKLQVSGVLALREDARIDVASGALLENRGRFTIEGGSRVDVAGRLDSGGQLGGSIRLENSGILAVQAGGSARIGNGAHFDGSREGTVEGLVLGSGRWEVRAGSRPDQGASLEFTPFQTLGGGASVYLSGFDARFNAFSRLEGNLEIDDHDYVAASGFDNLGELIVGGGGSVTIANSANLVNDTLTSGRWIVRGDGADESRLLLSNGARIRFIDAGASVLLSGTAARFDQLENFVAVNAGSFEIRDGRRFDARRLFDNQGTFRIGENASALLRETPHLNGGRLSGGRWDVDAGAGTATLALGGRAGDFKETIDTIDVLTHVRLAGAGATFAQLEGSLRSVKGSFTLGAGRRFVVGDFSSTGQITLEPGSILELAGTQGRETVFGPTGRLSNAGTLAVRDGVHARVLGTSNLLPSQSPRGSAQTLNGGEWIVGAGGLLEFGNEKSSIDIEAIGPGTRVLLRGAGARIQGLDRSLHSVAGELTVDGAELTLGAADFVNEGVLRVQGDATDASLTLIAPSNLRKGALHGGRWEVIADDATSLLAVGSGAITTLEAGTEVLLSGAGASFKQLNGALSRNRGSLTLANGQVLRTASKFINEGSLQLLGGGRLDLGPGGSLSGTGSLVLGDGDLTIGGSFAQGSTRLERGRLQGNGRVTGTVTMAGGTLAPGNSPGLLVFDDALTLFGPSTLEIELAGRARGEAYDAIDGKSVSLGGTLDVRLLDTPGGRFAPVAGDVFDIIIADSISGNFTQFVFAGLAPDLAWRSGIVGFGSRQAYRLEVLGPAPVPLPAGVWLLASALSVLLAGRRIGRGRSPVN
jgi:hypothetical protein